ncbi:MAG: RNA polymerase sigma factor, partial [Planctomycetota bacterium]
MKETRPDAMAVHRPAVRGFVFRHVGNEALADDLTQETYLRVQRSSAGHRGEASVRSWLCAIALNVIRDHFRAAGRVPQLTSAPTALEGAATNED